MEMSFTRGSDVVGRFIIGVDNFPGADSTEDSSIAPGNYACHAARLGGEVYMVSGVGTGERGTAALEVLRDEARVGRERGGRGLDGRRSGGRGRRRSRHPPVGLAGFANTHGVCPCA